MWLDALYKNNKWNRAQIVEEKGQHEFVVSYEYKMHYLNDIMHRDSPRKGGSPGCSLVAVLITSFGQAGGFDVRPITSTHATWRVPTLFLFVVCSYLTLALALVCVGDTRKSVQ